jgi:hypothetical protein
MTPAIYKTTAENLIGATDAALQRSTGVDASLVSDFLDTTSQYASDALMMAEQLGLLTQKANGKFHACAPYAIYLVTANRAAKAAILRLILDQYQPYKTFRWRLTLTSGVPSEAATQTRAIHSLAAHRDVILETFTDLGTYANSLLSQGAGLFTPSPDDAPQYLKVVSEVVRDREAAELAVRTKLGDEVVKVIDPDEVLANIVTAYQKLEGDVVDSRSPVVYAANAIESFLVAYGQRQAVNVSAETGINAKADKLGAAKKIVTKHKNMLKYLGHVRNAADHGIDSEINREWTVSQETAIQYVHVAATTMADLVAFEANVFRV